jgi:hypothetical protein
MNFMRILKSIITLGLILIFNSLFAQRQKVLNLATYDDKAYHFGFLLGINSTNFQIKYTTQIKQYDSLMAVIAKPAGGFNLGIVTNARLGQYFDLRLIPQLSFAERNVVFFVRDSQGAYYELKKPVESTFIDFPLDLKYKSERLNNARAYLVMGGKYSLDLATNKRAKDSGDQVNIKLKRHSVSAQFGFGLDFYTTYFKFSPELKFGIGLNDVLIKDGGPYSGSINKLFNKTWLIGFTFE